MPLEVVSPFRPRGDQGGAIAALTDGLASGLRCQTLLGVTGSGKTHTMATLFPYTTLFRYRKSVV